jgi:hypothetical protein
VKHENRDHESNRGKIKEQIKSEISRGGDKGVNKKSFVGDKNRLLLL